MFLHVLRAAFVLAVVAVAWTYFIGAEDAPTSELGALQLHKPLVLLGVIGVALVVIALDIAISQKSLLAISALFFGIVVGMVLAFGLSLIIDLVIQSVRPDLRQPVHADVLSDEPVMKTDPNSGKTMIVREQVQDKVLVGYRDHPFVTTLKLIIGVICCYFSISFIIQTKDDVRFVIPYVEFAKQTKGNRPMLLDTSVIIDGRISDICDTRIVEAEMVVPRFVLKELQLIADSGDKLKRNRGRRGLDVLNKMQLNDKIDIQIMDVTMDRQDAKHTVDEMLVELAVKMNGRVVTNDYNLNKIAQLRGVTVINVNDLATALRPVFLPGERLEVKIIRPGDEPGQGVGYLDDGTMVVVEGAREHIGDSVPIAVTSSLQTSAGRMLFGRVDGDGAGGQRRSRSPRQA